MSTHAEARTSTRDSIVEAVATRPGRIQESTICHPCELARRVSSGIEVALYWSSADNSTFIELWQRASDETFAFAVAREQALDAFYHPFAHLPLPPSESA